MTHPIEQCGPECESPAPTESELDNFDQATKNYLKVAHADAYSRERVFNDAYLIGFKEGQDASKKQTPPRKPTSEDQKIIDKYARLIMLADSVITLTHPKLSDAEMNTLVTRQYIVWRDEKVQSGACDDEGRLTLTDRDDERAKPREHIESPDCWCDLRRYVEYDVYWKAQARIKELEAENKQFHEDGLKVYGSKIQLLNKRIKELEQERDRYREALEGIAKTDVSTTAPDFLWLQQWRHNTKDAAREALNDRA